MKDKKYWISLFVYSMMWIFGFKLFDLFLQKNNYSQKDTIKICVSGLVLMVIIYNSDYIDPI
jgi:hypothetical protein